MVCVYVRKSLVAQFITGVLIINRLFRSAVMSSQAVSVSSELLTGKTGDVVCITLAGQPGGAQHQHPQLSIIFVLLFVNISALQ